VCSWILSLTVCFQGFFVVVPFTAKTIRASHANFLNSLAVTIEKRGENAMTSIPVDILRNIMEHVDRAGLFKMCLLNKICCSCSQDVLYRDILYPNKSITLTLARSTVLARRVRSFHISGDYPELATALRNMSSLRSLGLRRIGDESILDGCTFKLDSFSTTLPNSESFQNFLNNQSSLTNLIILGDYEPMPPFDEKCLPNLTRVTALLPWLGILIPGRPVKEVIVLSPLDIDSIVLSPLDIDSIVLSPLDIDSIDLSFFTLSTTPIQKLWISYETLCPKPGSLLVSIFPSLVHLVVYVLDVEWTVRVPLCLSIYTELVDCYRLCWTLTNIL